MKKLLVLMLTASAVFAQNKIDYSMHQKIANNISEIECRGNVSTLTETNFDFDNDVMRKDYVSQKEVNFNKNKQLTKFAYRYENYVKENSAYVRKTIEHVYTNTYEEFPTYLKRRELHKSTVGHNHSSQHIYVKEGKSIFDKSFSATYELVDEDINAQKLINAEYVIDVKNQIIAEHEYSYTYGGKNGDSHLFEYNTKGQAIKETILLDNKIKFISTYKFNEHGDKSEEIIYDGENLNIAYARRLFDYTYDKNGNWLTRKITFNSYDNGKIEDYSIYHFAKREISYF